jgi:hypothetical protein
MAIAPNVILRGTLEFFWSEAPGGPTPDPDAYVQLALHGYGSQIPRVSGQALFQGATSTDVQMQSGAEAGGFEFFVYSNDMIEPPGTYYTLTTKNGNGDALQINAYRFIGAGNYDMSTVIPYDPNQPPPPLPPLITNLLLVVPWSDPMEFPGDVYTSFRTTLTGDVTSSTAPDTVQGNLYTFIIFQDAVGGHKFTWPSNTINASPINPAPNGLTVQTFVMGLSDLAAIGPATWI